MSQSPSSRMSSSKRTDRRSLASIASLLVLLLAVACSGSGGGGDAGGGDANGAASAQTTTQTEGAVAILLTDAPADPSLFSEINTVINRIELIGADDEARGTVYDGDARTIDLLDLRLAGGNDLFELAVLALNLNQALTL